MARAKKKVEAPQVDPAIAWSASETVRLDGLRELFKATGLQIDELVAAQHRGINVEEFRRRVKAEEKRQDKIIARLKAATEQMGGTVSSVTATGIFGDTQYTWHFKFKLNNKWELEFTLCRGPEADAYDLPLSFQWRVWQHGRKSFGRVAFVTPYNDHDYHDCESVPEFKKAIKSVVKWLNDTRGFDNKKEITLA